MSLAYRRGPVRPPARQAETGGWLVLQASAVLDAVATTNYACYGRGGVPRYPRPATSPASEQAPTLCVEALLRDPAGEVKLACLDLDLALHERNERQIVWLGYDAPRRLQVAWVWDFYRILSHAVLRVPIPPRQEMPDPAWVGAVEALRAAGPGYELEFRVRSACGDIRQVHRIERPAVPWSPPRAAS